MEKTLRRKLTRKNNRLERVLNGAGVLLVMFVICTVLPLSLPKLAGVRVFGVLSGSMEPAYAVGGVIYVKPCDASGSQPGNADGLQLCDDVGSQFRDVYGLLPGDVITYRLSSDTENVMTHRIVSVDSETGTFRTKGDANDSVDPEPVRAEQIVGKVVFYLPGLAFVAAFLENPEGIAAAATLLILAAVCWMLADLAGKQTRDTIVFCPVARILAVILIVGACCYLGVNLMQYRESDREYNQLKRQVFGNAGDQDAGEKTSEALHSGTGELQDEAECIRESGLPDEALQQSEAIHRAVGQLMQTNEDMIGWIIFDNLDISYPVMQGEDNEYYLRHTFSGRENPAGSIFMDAINHDTWEDAHTIVYGHNMKNLSMFGRLRNYRAKDFYQGNEFFSVFTDGEIYRYQIFAFYDVSEDSDIYTVWYTPDEKFAEMIGRMKEKSYYETGVETDAEDKILTLSTCSSEGKRFVLHAKQVNRE